MSDIASVLAMTPLPTVDRNSRPTVRAIRIGGKDTRGIPWRRGSTWRPLQRKNEGGVEAGRRLLGKLGAGIRQARKTRLHERVAHVDRSSLDSLTDAIAIYLND